MCSMGAALGAGEDGGVELFGNIRVVAQQHPAPGAPEGLVGGGGNNISIRHRALVIAACHQTGNVGHIHHQICTIAVGDLSDLLKSMARGYADAPATISLGRTFLTCFSSLSIVDHAVGIDTVRDKVIVLAGHVHRRTVGQMPP